MRKTVWQKRNLDYGKYYSYHSTEKRVKDMGDVIMPCREGHMIQTCSSMTATCYSCSLWDEGEKHMTDTYIMKQVIRRVIKDEPELIKQIIKDSLTIEVHHDLNKLGLVFELSTEIVVKLDQKEIYSSRDSVKIDPDE